MAEEKLDEFPSEEEIAKEDKKSAEEAGKEDEVKEEGKEKEPDKKEEEKEPEIEEPEARKSAKDYIIERKDKKIEKLEKKEEENLGEEELTPEGRKAIDKGVDKATSPILKTLKTQSDEQELAEVMKNHAGAKKMEKQIRKYMEHPAYKSASVEFIYLALAAKRDRLQVKKDEANEDAKKNKTGGNSRRKLDEGKLPDFKGMSDKEFDEWEKEHPVRL